jgi:hypothetical protein
MSNEFKNRLDHQLSALEWNQTDSYTVLQKVRGGIKVKKKISVAVIFAMVLMLALLGVAIAASLGVFGQFAGNETNGHKLQNLESVSTTYGKTQTTEPLLAAGVQTSKAEDVYTQVLEHQKERTFDFTLEQAHFDGKTIAISYTFQKHGDWDIVFGEGMPTGDISWDYEKKGEKYVDTHSSTIEAVNQAVKQLDGTRAAYIMIDYAGPGDGFYLEDGTPLDNLDSGMNVLADGSMKGYGEYGNIPEKYRSAQNVQTSLNVSYGTEIIYQDTLGYKVAFVRNPENRGLAKFYFSILRDGKTLLKTGEAAFEGYSAKAELTVSQVDIQAALTMKCPEDWTLVWTQMGEFKAKDDYVYDYALYADGKICKETDCSVKVIAPDQLELSLRYNLPASFQELTLRPVYMRGGEKAEEDIVIR